MKVGAAIKRMFVKNYSSRLKTAEERRYTSVLPSSLAGINLPRVSVVIPTRNRRKVLDACVDSLIAQTIKPFEIIIVDDGHFLHNGLKQKIESAGITCSIVSNEVISGISASRNRGERRALGEIVFFADDDIFFDKEYLEQTLRIFVADKEKKIGGVDGFWVNKPRRGGVKATIFHLFQPFGEEYDGLLLPNGYLAKVNWTNHPTRTNVFGGVAAFRKEVFEKEHYDEVNFPGYTKAEDSEFANRVAKEWQLVFMPLSRFWHHPAEGGRPGSFKAGIQSAYRPIKLLSLTGPSQGRDFILTERSLLGEVFFSLCGAVISKGRRKEFALSALGQAFGIATPFLAVPQNDPVSHLFALWLSRGEDSEK
ncbi:MAG: glycosyltransferase [Candidatus Margulisiibacteriota bacterium]